MKNLLKNQLDELFKKFIHDLKRLGFCPNCGNSTDVLVKGICPYCGVENDRATESLRVLKKWDKKCFDLIADLEPLDQECALEWMARREKVVERFKARQGI